MNTFKLLGLSEPLVKALVEAGYSSPTPIQAEAIPLALDGEDLTGCAQTGTGKTAAFVLPTLERLLPAPVKSKWRPIRALVVVPTRELAQQVEDSVRTYGRFTGLRSIAVFGGVGYGPQINAFRRGVDLVIATPGRLIDHLNMNALNLSKVEVFILDEADRMFDMGFVNDIKRIVKHIPRQRQTLLFSATMPPAIQKLASSIQRQPQLVEVGRRTNPAQTVTQRFYRVSNAQKTDLLLHILYTEDVDNVLVFSRTKHRATKIARKLAQKGIASAPIHSDRTQGQRRRALADFKSGKVDVLVATDIAARGIDVDGISHVINYDTPFQPEDYIHRIGRTGRAESTGDAVTFVASEEIQYARRIEKLTGQKLSRELYPGFAHGEQTVDETDTVTEAAPVRKRSSGNGSGRKGRSYKGRNHRGGGYKGGNRNRKSRARRPQNSVARASGRQSLSGKTGMTQNGGLLYEAVHGCSARPE
ncbi:MAG: DEAD/DEAH box helicase [Rubricoccaceae bacterium]|nr:DEAD/DEAH box helicase [Rubricoccaceae bacterium]